MTSGGIFTQTDSTRKLRIRLQVRNGCVLPVRKPKNTYIQGRIKAYSHLFTEISPPIPKDLEKSFMVHGYLLPGYVTEEMQQTSLENDDRGNLIQPGVSAYKWKCILKKINKYMPEGEVTNITPHYFRHNFTTDLVYAGVPLKTVQAIMGHENIQTTMDIYADVRYDNNDVIHKLSSYLG